MNFLNIKTNYNIGESTITIDDLIEFGETNNLTSLFLIDNNLKGVADFCFSCSKKKIKPIIGLNIILNSIQIILIAKTYNGYLTLVRINNSFKDNKINDLNLFLQKNLTDLVVVYEYKQNINEIVNNIKNNSINCDFLIGLNLNNSKEYLNIDEYVWIEEINCLNKINEICLNIINPNIKCKKLIELEKLKQIIDINIHNKTISKINDLVIFDIFKDSSLNFYHENSNEKAAEIIKKNSLDVLNKYCKNQQIKSKYVKRLMYELNIVKKLNFCNYFLIVSEIAKIARTNNIFVGPGRGSASGSLIAFCLNITMVDPIKYGLLFERFLNPERIGYPDIDIDIQDNKREQLLTILNERYKNKFALISSYKTYGYKKAISIYFQNQGLKENEIRLKQSLFLDLKKNCLNYDHIKKENLSNEFINVIENLAKLKEAISTHAAGIIISQTDISKSFPIFSLKFDQIQFQGEYLEKLGLIKIDLLALSNLTGLTKFIKSIENNTNKKIILRFINFNNKTFELLSKGNTLGIFQLGSKGIQNTIKEIKPKNIFEVADVLALYRPGPIDQIPLYVKRKNYGYKYNKNDLFASVLKNTYGIMIYQEQVMKILQNIANFTLIEADNIRRAISKKDLILLKKYEQLFVENSIKNNLSKDDALTKWNWILKFANYGFNKAHAISYSIIVCWYAYFKANYPLDFYVVNLNRCSKTDLYYEYIEEILNRNIQIKTPSIFDTHKEFIYENDQIFLPLHAINGINKNIYDHLKITKDSSIFTVIKILKIDCQIDLKTFKNLVFANVFSIFKLNQNILIYLYKYISPHVINLKIDQNEIEEINYSNEQLFINEYNAFGFNINRSILDLNIKKHIKDNLVDLKLVNTKKIVYVLGFVNFIETLQDKNKKNYLIIHFLNNNKIYKIYLFNNLYSSLQKNIIKNNLYVFKINCNLHNEKMFFELKEIINYFKVED